MINDRKALQQELRTLLQCNMRGWNEFLKNHGAELTLEDFRAIGNLSLVMEFAAHGYMGPWNFIQARFTYELTIEDFRVTVEAGVYQGKTLLWLATVGAIKNHNGPWNFIKEHFLDVLTVKDFCTAAEGDWEKKSILWLAVLAVMQDYRIELWNFIRAHFADELTIEYFRVVIEAGDDKGKTILWLTMLAATHGDIGPWNFIQDHFADELTLEDFRVVAEAGDDKGKTGLWLAILTVSHGHIGLWDFILKHFLAHLTVQDFLAKSGEQTLLSIIINMPNRNARDKILGAIMSQCFFVLEDMNIEKFSRLYAAKRDLIAFLDKTCFVEPQILLAADLPENGAEENKIYIKKQGYGIKSIFKNHEGKQVENHFPIQVDCLNEESLPFIKDEFLSIARRKRILADPEKLFEKLLELIESARKEGFSEACYMAAMHEKMALSKEKVLELLLKVDRESLHYDRANQLGLAESIALLEKKERGDNDLDLFKKAALFCLHLKDLKAFKDLFRCYFYKRFDKEYYDPFLEEHKFDKKINALINLKAEDDVLVSLVIQFLDLITKREENRELKKELMGELQPENTSTPMFDAGKRKREATSTEEELPMKRMNSRGI